MSLMMTANVVAQSLIYFESLQNWQRQGGPVLQDYEFDSHYQVAADPHVFRTQDGELKMVYTGPDPVLGSNGHATIKLASLDSNNQWLPDTELLMGSEAHNLDLNKETSFYRLSDSGKHQIYYIGYQSGSEYISQIFMAEANELEGPYTLPSAPLINTGDTIGFPVRTITSPSIVAYDNRLYMVYCAWNDFPYPTEVQVHGAISEDDGHNWQPVGEVNVPVCMEGALTTGPDGLFYAVASTNHGFSIGRSAQPFPETGYDMLPEPVMTATGAPWEVDEMNTPQLFFEDGRAYLYYSGADYLSGWWIMRADTGLVMGGMQPQSVNVWNLPVTIVVILLCGLIGLLFLSQSRANS